MGPWTLSALSVHKGFLGRPGMRDAIEWRDEKPNRGPVKSTIFRDSTHSEVYIVGKVSADKLWLEPVGGRGVFRTFPKALIDETRSAFLERPDEGDALACDLWDNQLDQMAKIAGVKFAAGQKFKIRHHAFADVPGAYQTPPDEYTRGAGSWITRDDWVHREIIDLLHRNTARPVELEIQDSSGNPVPACHVATPQAIKGQLVIVAGHLRRPGAPGVNGRDELPYWFDFTSIRVVGSTTPSASLKSPPSTLATLATPPPSPSKRRRVGG